MNLNDSGGLRPDGLAGRLAKQEQGGKNQTHRARLEAARLDLPALFRALDRLHLAPEQIPQRLIRQLFELDADYMEAPWALDQPPGTIIPRSMLRDTLAALEQLPAACSRFQKTLPPKAQPTLSQLKLTIRSNLGPMEAYNPDGGI